MIVYCMTYQETTTASIPLAAARFAASDSAATRDCGYSATSLRQAVVAVLDEDELQERPWLGGANESDQVPIFNLRATLAAEAARCDRGWSLAQRFARMRVVGEWGDGNTLIGTALLFV